MALAELTARSRSLWQGLAGSPAEFAPELSVAVAPQSRLGPPGWIAFVTIGGTVIATAPDIFAAREVQRALSGLSAASVTGPGVLASRLTITDMLGPATLAYLDAADFRPQPGPPAESLPDPALAAFIAEADPGDLEESGIQEITSPAFAVREHGQVAAVAGYRDWPGRTAHLSVLTAARARGRGLAKVAASAATAHALADGRLPQWRARPAASRRIAVALGYRELGAQVSLR